jgi:hypothetical protein
MPLALPLRRDALRLVAASWAARLSFVLAMPAAAHSVDVDHWIEVSNLLAAGINPYGATTYLNWPPVWMQLAYVIGRATTVLDVPFLRVLQVFLIGVESVLMVFVLRLVRDLAPDVDAFKVVPVRARPESGRDSAGLPARQLRCPAGPLGGPFPVSPTPIPPHGRHGRLADGVPVSRPRRPDQGRTVRPGPAPGPPLEVAYAGECAGSRPPCCWAPSCWA